MTACIQLKSGGFIDISNFKYITYPDGKGGIVKIEKFDNFYLYNHLLTFVGEKTIVSISSKDIEFIRFDN